MTAYWPALIGATHAATREVLPLPAETLLTTNKPDCQRHLS